MDLPQMLMPDAGFTGQTNDDFDDEETELENQERHHELVAELGDVFDHMSEEDDGEEQEEYEDFNGISRISEDFNDISQVSESVGTIDSVQSVMNQRLPWQRAEGAQQTSTPRGGYQPPPLTTPSMISHDRYADVRSVDFQQSVEEYDTETGTIELPSVAQKLPDYCGNQEEEGFQKSAKENDVEEGTSGFSSDSQQQILNSYYGNQANGDGYYGNPTSGGFPQSTEDTNAEHGALPQMLPGYYTSHHGYQQTTMGVMADCVSPVTGQHMCGSRDSVAGQNIYIEQTEGNSYPIVDFNSPVNHPDLVYYPGPIQNVDIYSQNPQFTAHMAGGYYGGHQLPFSGQQLPYAGQHNLIAGELIPQHLYQSAVATSQGYGGNYRSNVEEGFTREAEPLPGQSQKLPQQSPNQKSPTKIPISTRQIAPVTNEIEAIYKVHYNRGNFRGPKDPEVLPDARTLEGETARGAVTDGQATKNQEEFLSKDGNRDSRQLAQLEILYEARGKEIKRLKDELLSATETLETSIRIHRHELCLKEDERNEAVKSLECCQQLLAEVKTSKSQADGQLEALHLQLKALKNEKEELMRKLISEKTTIDVLNTQLSELASTENQMRMKHQNETIVMNLRSKYESDLLHLKEQQDKMSAQLKEKDEMIIDLKKRLSDVTRSAENDRIDHAEKMNRMTRMIQDSQDRYTKLLESGSGSGIAQVKVQLKDTEARKSMLEDLNGDLQREIQELKEQLKMFEAASQFGFLQGPSKTASPPSVNADDSYAQLCIKNPHPMKNSSEPVSNYEALKNEFERCFVWYKEKRQEAAALRTELKSTKGNLKDSNDKLETALKTLQENQRKLEELGDCQPGQGIVEKRLERQLELVAKEKELLEKEIKELQCRLDETGLNEERANELNRELSRQMAEMVKEHDRDRQQTEAEHKIALERLHKTFIEHHEATLEKQKLDLREERDEELSKMRSAWNSLEKELVETKELYLDVCQSKDSLADDLNREWKVYHTREIEELKENLAWEKKKELDNLQQAIERDHGDVRSEEGRKMEDLRLEKEKKEKELENLHLEKKKMEKQLESLQVEKEKELENLHLEKKKMEKQLESLQVEKEQKEKEMENLLMEQGKNLEILRSEKEKAVEKLQQEKKELENLFLRKEKEIENLISEKDREIRTLFKAAEDQKLKCKELESEIQRTKDSAKTELQLAFNAKLNEELSTAEERWLAKHQLSIQSRIDAGIAEAKDHWRLAEMERWKEVEFQQELDKAIQRWSCDTLQKELNSAKDDWMRTTLAMERRAWEMTVLPRAVEGAKTKWRTEELFQAVEKAKHEAIDEAEARFVKQLEEALADWKERFQTTSKDYARELEILKIQHKEELAKVRDATENEWLQKMENALLEKEAQNREEREKLIQVAQDRVQEQFVKMNEHMTANQDISCQAQLTECQAQLADYQNQLAECRAHLEECQTKLAECEVRFDQKLAAHLNSQRQKAQKFFVEFKSKCDAQLAEGKDKWSQERNALTEDLQKFGENERTWKKEKSDLENRLLELQKLFTRAGEEINAMEEMVRNKQDELANCHERIGEQETKLNKMEIVCRHMSRVQESAEREHTVTVELLRDKLIEQSREHYSAMEGMRQTQMKEVRALKEQLEVAVKRIEDLQELEQEQGVPSMHTRVLEEIKNHYMEAVRKIKEEVVCHMATTNRQNTEIMKQKLLKERRRTARSLRKYYLQSLDQLLQRDFDSSFRAYALQTMENILDNFLDRLNSPRSFVSSSSAYTTPRENAEPSGARPTSHQTTPASFPKPLRPFSPVLSTTAAAANGLPDSPWSIASSYESFAKRLPDGAARQSGEEEQEEQRQNYRGTDRARNASVTPTPESQMLDDARSQRDLYFSSPSKISIEQLHFVSESGSRQRPTERRRKEEQLCLVQDVPDWNEAEICEKEEEAFWNLALSEKTVLSNGRWQNSASKTSVPPPSLTMDGLALPSTSKKVSDNVSERFATTSQMASSMPSFKPHVDAAFVTTRVTSRSGQTLVPVDTASETRNTDVTKRRTVALGTESSVPVSVLIADDSANVGFSNIMHRLLSSDTPVSSQFSALKSASASNLASPGDRLNAPLSTPTAFRHVSSVPIRTSNKRPLASSSHVHIPSVSDFSEVQLVMKPSVSDMRFASMPSGTLPANRVPFMTPPVSQNSFSSSCSLQNGMPLSVFSLSSPSLSGRGGNPAITSTGQPKLQLNKGRELIDSSRGAGAEHGLVSETENLIRRLKNTLVELPITSSPLARSADLNPFNPKGNMGLQGQGLSGSSSNSTTTTSMPKSSAEQALGLEARR